MTGNRERPHDRTVNRTLQPQQLGCGIDIRGAL